ncbi:MAG: acetylglutamate kinase [Flavobacteriaceae bacterium]|jgi:acetylglutamate kinase|nr:acetylglutamate kinase [Flavobacteriaceae bacterium]
MSKLNIVKVGGNVIENPKVLFPFLQEFAKLEGNKILVHGGGKKATLWAERLGIPVQMNDGRRITDAETLELITGIYGGQVNKNIVTLLQGLDCNAIGLSGADGNAIQAKKRPTKPIDYGFVGDVTLVNSAFFVNLLKQKLSPVCCALTHTGSGQILNTNADTIASKIAVALSTKFEVNLFYCFEKPGVLESVEEDDSLIEHIDPKKYKELKEHKIIHEGMLPKMKNAFDALNQGVSKVAIGKPEMIGGKIKHTSITL